MQNDEEDDRQYQVVVNHEEQYSIWLAGRDIPGGWRAAGKDGTKAECLAHIEEIWSDMRPLSLRRQLDGDTAPRGLQQPPTAALNQTET